MSPLLDSVSHGLRPVRNPLIRGALQQRGKKLLVESNSHNRAGRPPDWGPPRSRTRQLPKVVAGLSLVGPGPDLLVAHATSVEKVLTHGNIVYETRSQSLPLYRNTQQPATTTEPDNDPTLYQPADASELLPAVDRRCPAGGDLLIEEPTAADHEQFQDGASYWPRVRRVLPVGPPRPMLRDGRAQRGPAGGGVLMSRVPQWTSRPATPEQFSTPMQVERLSNYISIGPNSYTNQRQLNHSSWRIYS